MDSLTESVSIYDRIAAAINAYWPTANASNQYPGAIHITPDNQPAYVLGDINATWNFDFYPDAEAYSYSGPSESFDTEIPRDSHDAEAIARAFLAQILARKFSEVLLRDIGPAKVRLAILRNLEYARKHPENPPCASHDFCDANMDMLEAFQTFGIPHDISEDATVELWNQAWGIAIRNRFYVSSEIAA